MSRIYLLILLLGISQVCCNKSIPGDQSIYCDVLVYGSGTGAISSAIQSARGGATTILISPLPWLGGMLSSAGVSAIDGNHNMPSGLWGEFREEIYAYYGGPDSVSTGWVSNTNFEPHVGNDIWKLMGNGTNNLIILYEYHIKSIVRDKNWSISVANQDESKTFITSILIDGTDLGDLLPLANISFDIGWDQDVTDPIGFSPGDDYLQDLTYCAILKDYKSPQNVPEPPGYFLNEFKCACKTNCDKPMDAHECSTMLSYAKLPNEKYLLNWPINGNDLYPTKNILELEHRPAILAKAKAKTIRFAYYIHSHLGQNNLWLADDEFDTPDLLPYNAYYREGRRMQGKTRLQIRHLSSPYNHDLYRTGIGVGDYPVDHHHDEHAEHTQRAEFPKIPSFTVPLGTLLPRNISSFLVADKSISVSHEVNGTTRLQPVIIQIGQCAGALASLSIKLGVSIDQVSIRQLQQTLLNHNVYLQPFLDVHVNDNAFQSIQRIGCTGLLRGVGIPNQWANQTWFYPDSSINSIAFLDHIEDLIPNFTSNIKTEDLLPISGAILITYELLQHLDEGFTQSKAAYFLKIQNQWDLFSNRRFQPFLQITKRELALLLDIEVDPFNKIPIDLKGKPKYQLGASNKVKLD